MNLPFAVLTSTYRDAPASERRRLALISRELFSENEELKKLVSAMATLETCSRTEILLSAANPQWAAEMVKAIALKKGISSERFHIRTESAAARHVLEVACGLDSVAEGEAAVGRQFLRGLRDAHSHGQTDKVLRLVWKHVERAVHRRREIVPDSNDFGVQSLVTDLISQERTKDGSTHPVVIYGLGEMGKAVERALARQKIETRVCARKDIDKLNPMLENAQTLVVCTGASEAYLELPRARDVQMYIDVGMPTQVRNAPGWQAVTLDDLLSGTTRRLPQAQVEELEEVASELTGLLISSLQPRTEPARLFEVSELGKKFLHEELPQLLEGLPKAKSMAIRSAVAKLTHQIVVTVKEL